MSISRRRILKTLAAGVLLPEVLSGTRNVWSQAAIGAGRKALALVVGLNAVDPNAYGGWDGRLNGCVNDANDYERILTEKFRATPRLSWDVHSLHTSEATVENVAGAILGAAKILRAGDLFVMTNSSHGGQIPDTTGDEEDRFDETLCLYNGEMYDDELYRFWQCFDQDVRIVVISDSCHSGSVARVLQRAAEVEKEIQDPKTNLSLRAKEISGDTFESVKENIVKRSQRVSARTVPQLSTRDGVVAARNELALFREMPAAIIMPAFAARRNYYERIAATLPRTSKAEMRSAVRASVLTLGSALDDQLAMEIGQRGLFTSVFTRLFPAATSYQELRDNIAKEMPSKQQPSFDSFGTSNQTFLTGERPFTV
jgi:metacaspase-1